MRLKSYFAGTVEAAMDKARREIGPEALLVDTRKAMPEARHLGEYEVVFAAPEPARREKEAPPPGLDRLSAEVAELRRQVEVAAAALARSHSQPGPAEAASGGLLRCLLAAEVRADLAHHLAEKARLRGGGRKDPDSLRRGLIAELGLVAPAGPRLGRDGCPRRVVAVVGPPGSGKTTTLVKLAVQFGLTARRPCQILSLDTYRIAAAEQLRCYAAILGVGFQVAETARALAQSLEEHCNKDLVLVDTPGYGAREMENAAEAAALLAGHPEVDTHLVLTATMKSADLRVAVERYEVFKPGKLIFTRLDETGTCGGIVNEALESKKPVSFLTDGQRIPEDLHEAKPETIADLLLENRGALTAAA